MFTKRRKPKELYSFWTSAFPQQDRKQPAPFGKEYIFFWSDVFVEALNLNNTVTADSLTMSYVAKGEKDYDATGAPVAAKVHKIRITLTSSNVRNLEKCTLSFPSEVIKVLIY